MCGCKHLQNANVTNEGDGGGGAKRKVRKSILKRPAPEEHGEVDEDEGEDDSLFALLLPSGTAVALVASDWRAKYGADPAAALAELYTLVARVRNMPMFFSTSSQIPLARANIFFGGAHISRPRRVRYARKAAREEKTRRRRLSP